MAELRVEYTVKLVEFIDWPDDELNNLNYENLKCNLNINNSSECEYEDITHIEKDDEEFIFNT